MSPSVRPAVPTARRASPMKPPDIPSIRGRFKGIVKIIRPEIGLSPTGGARYKPPGRAGKEERTWATRST